MWVQENMSCVLLRDVLEPVGMSHQGFHEINDFYPLVIAQHVGTLSDDAVRAQLASDHARLVQRVERSERNIAIFDMTHMGAISPLQREAMGNFLRDNLEALRASLVGTAFIVPNMLKRGIMQAIFWVQRYPLPHTIVGDMDAALAWVLRRADETALPLPDALRQEGVSAFEHLLYHDV